MSPFMAPFDPTLSTLTPPFEPMDLVRDFDDTSPMFFVDSADEYPNDVPQGELPALPQMWDVEREYLPWFPLACIGAALLGAFLPPLVEWLRFP